MRKQEVAKNFFCLKKEFYKKVELFFKKKEKNWYNEKGEKEEKRRFEKVKKN